MIIIAIIPIEKNKPIIPGIFNPLSKHGLDAIAGRMLNRSPGEYWNNKLESESIIIETYKIVNSHSMMKLVINHPTKLNKGTSRNVRF